MTELHPFALLLPEMSAQDFAALKQSIAENGQREPVTLHRNGQLIDGRHRARACVELGIPLRTKIFDGPDSDVLDFVLDMNLNRRHLDESQRAMIAADLANMRQGARTDLAQICAMSQAEAADRLNVSRRTTQHATLVRERAIPEIAAAVRQGNMPVSKAAVAATLPADKQQAIASQLGNGKSISTLVLAAKRADRVERIEQAARCVPLSELGRTFPVIYADPPWQFETWSDGGKQKAADMHYPTMPLADICALKVSQIAAKDAVLFMWAVPAMWPEALDVVKAWGFTYKTEAVWVKPNIACGHWFRGQHEPLIVATRGNMPPPPILHSSVFSDDQPPGRHSEKPAAMRDWIASAYPAAGKIELFARTATPGWFAWGNQAAAA